MRVYLTENFLSDAPRDRELIGFLLHDPALPLVHRWRSWIYDGIIGVIFVALRALAAVGITAEVVRNDILVAHPRLLWPACRHFIQ
eukprot:325000-Prorocentrum_lima.AAC.1